MPKQTPMAEHEPSIGAIDLDPCSPGPGHWVPARKIYTKADDGLRQPWESLVWVNPLYVPNVWPAPDLQVDFYDLVSISLQ
jgi:hypothetical protein